jgi:hypothetical protein
MTVRLDNGVILLEGDCTIDDAEALLRHLLATPGAQVAWRGCEKLHAAVLQVMLASGRSPAGMTQNAFLNDLVRPLFGRVDD